MAESVNELISKEDVIRKAGYLLIKGELKEEFVEDAVAWYEGVVTGIFTEPTVVIHSEGGDLHTGLCIVDLVHSLRARGYEVPGMVLGYSMSAATVVLQACKPRYVMKHSWVQTHGPVAHMGQVDLYDFVGKDSYFNELVEQLAQLFAEANTSDWGVEFWRESMAKTQGTYYAAEDALDAGLVDGIREEESAN